MKIRSLLPVVSLLFLVSPAMASTEDADVEGAVPGRWTQDYEAAIVKAREEKLPVLLKFTGSDWCGWCKLMERSVFSTDEFADWADGRVLLVTIDQPRNEDLVPEKYRMRNSRLFGQYGIRGVPCYVVQSADGAELGRLGASQGATVESFTARFERIAGNSLPEKGAVPKGGAKADAPAPDLAVVLAYAANDPALKPLEQMSSLLVESLRKKKDECDKKEETLRAQMVSALDKAKAAAQSKGDLDGVLLFEEAEKNPDVTPETANTALLEIFKTRDQARAGYRAALDQDRARILAAAVAQLEKMKSEETRKGNIALAKEVASYQKTVQETLERIQKGSGAAGSGGGAAGAAGRPAQEASAEKRQGPPDVGGTSRNIVVPVNKENGANLGRFEKDEILLVQYLSGDYRPYRSASRTVNPDQESDYYYSSEGAMMLEGPLNSQDKRSYRIPRGTSRKPFALLVPVGGHFNLRCTAGNYSEGKVSYKITKLSVLEAREFQKSANKNAYQWP